MEPVRLFDDAEFWLPPEFLTDDDFLVEKVESKESWEYDSSRGFGFEDEFLTGLSRKMVQSTLEDDFSCGKAWSTTRSPQSRASSQAEALDLYFAAAAELAMMNKNGYNNLHNGRGLLDLSNNRSGFYNRQSLQYQKLQAIQFQQLKQQQLMKHHRQLTQQRVNNLNHTKITGHGCLSPSAWPQRRDVAGLLGDRTGNRSSTGTGVFFPRRVINQTSPVTGEVRNRPSLGTVLVPAKVVHQPAAASLNDVSWRQRSNNGGYSRQMKIIEHAVHAVNEPRLPSEWAY